MSNYFNSNKPYSQFSYIYDKLMSDYHYEDIILYILNNVSNLKKGLDIGCGTGKISYELAKCGMEMIAVDASADMLQNRKIHKNIIYINEDINKFKLLHKVDFIIAMCDVVNYIADLNSFFSKLKIFSRQTEYLFSIFLPKAN